MTEQQIDRDQLRAVADHAEQANSAVYLAPRSLRSLLDQLDQAEAELDSWMTRAYEAEKRAWKAEQRLAEWMEHWNTTARTGAVDEVAAILEANTRADHAEARLVEEKHLRMKATAAATKVEARIKAVRDALDRWQVDGYDALLRRIRRALESDPPPGQ